MEEPIAELLESYGFESLQGEPAGAAVARWSLEFEPDWVRLAVLEALHQGRYKVISVEQILRAWQRRGRPTYHFGSDFERLVCQNLPRPSAPQLDAGALSPQPPAVELPAIGDNQRPDPPAAIAPFAPQPDVSALYAKLRAVAQEPPEASDPEADV